MIADFLTRVKSYYDRGSKHFDHATMLIDGVRFAKLNRLSEQNVHELIARIWPTLLEPPVPQNKEGEHLQGLA